MTARASYPAAAIRVIWNERSRHIGTAVSRACAQAAKLGAAGSPLRLLGVTVLTSYDDHDLAEAGYAYGAADLVARRAAQAREAGLDGLVKRTMTPAAAVAAGADYLVIGRPVTRVPDRRAAAEANLAEMTAAQP